MEIPGYEIIGELAVDRDARRYLARRTEDGASVLITVVGVPEGDEGNALNHLASDTKLMMTHPHHGLVPVLDARWVGEEFAVITPRPVHPSLEELLVRRDEEFPFVRIATILRDINAALLWARERGIVHRAIRLENVFIEPGSDRTAVAFNVRPIGLTDTPSAGEDDRTIAGLATAMFTRGRRPEQEETSLAELRPGLPVSLVAQTEALLGKRAEGDETPPPDVTSYIASIAMAEALKEAELHLEKNRNIIEEQRRQHEAQLEKERREHAEALAKERAAHQKEREAHQRDRECYERDLQVLRIERAKYEEERERLRRERADYDKEMSAILAQKARQRTREGVELMARGWRRRPMWMTRMTSNWKKTAPILAAAVLVLIAAIAVSRRESAGPPTAAAVVADSAAGLVTVPPSLATPAPVAPAVATDSLSRESASADSLGVPRGFVASVVARAESLWARRPFRSAPATAPETRTTETPRPRPQRQFDTIYTTPQLPPPDTIRRDTIVRRDSVVVPIDTIASSQLPDTLSRH